MKKRLYTLIIVLFIGFQYVKAQNTSNTSKGKIKVDGRELKIKTKKSFNIKVKTTSAQAKALPIDEPCLLDPNTGECVDVTDPSDPVITTEAGSTAGSLSVSLTGAASYSIPVMVPPGIKDVAPTIGISYTSQGANGLAGWGWNISGLSTISRVPATKYYDNKHDGVDFLDDRFSLDGQRLILKSGTYGASGSVYQTENYSNIKVVAYGTSPYGSTYGPSYFIVYYPDGTRVWYGNSGNSRSRIEWAIFRWQDPQGNYIDYNYQSDNGLLSIKTIKYGGRIGSTSPMNQINFTYASRNRPESVYVGEYNFKRTNLLKSIQVTASGSQYRKYELTHNVNSLGYNRLISVKEYNKDNKELTPITFDYETTTSTFKSKTVSGDLYPGFDYKTSKLIAGDYDGDGRTDVIFYDITNKNNIYLHYDLYNQYGSFAYQIPTGGFSDVFSSTNLNDVGGISDQQTITTVKETSLSTSSTSAIRFRNYIKLPYGVYVQFDKIWNTAKYRTDNYCGSSSYRSIPKKYISGDFNGDGITDVLAIEKQYTSQSCYPRDCDDGGGLEPFELKKEETNNSKEQSARLPIEECCDCNSYTTNKYNAKVHFIDLKRNVTSNFSKISGYLRKGVGTKDRFEVGDHNGDGKQDIYHFQGGKLYVYTLDDNNNLVLLYEETDSGIKLWDGNYQIPILLGDYNGDGKTDFLIATANESKNWRFFISKGKEFYKETKNLGIEYVQDKLLAPYTGTVNGVTMDNPYIEFRYVAQDVNGDGKTDLIVHNVFAPYSSYDKSVEYISVHKNTFNISDASPTFPLEFKYEKNNGGVNKYGMPIFLESNRTNGNLEYGYVSVNNIFMYEFAKDHRKDGLLKNVTNNGVKVTIDYERLGDSDNYGPVVYTPNYGQVYPYFNVNRAPSFQLVKKLTEEGAGIKRYQDFRYEGAVSNINIGFQGFVKTRRSNWYGNDVSTLWTISKHDVTKKGAVTEQWVSTSSYEVSNYMSKTTYTYSSSLSSNKVFIIVPTKIEQHDALTGVTTTKTITYDSYKNPLTENTVYNGGNENITYTYSNNISVNSQYYHVGRLTKKVETNTIGANVFTTEEEYSYNNNLLTQQKVKGNGTSWNIESYTYDVYGNVIEKTLTPSGDVIPRTEKFKYDIPTKRFLIESTDVEEQVTKFTYDIFGNPLTATNPYNQITTFTYDGWNRLISEKNYLGKVTNYIYTYLNGGGIRETTNYPQGKDRIKEYNALGWVIKRGELSINNKWMYKSIHYDVVGRIVKESEPYFSFPSQWNTTSYDNYGRVVNKTTFNGLLANISYNGLIVTVDDGTKTVKTTKDGMDNITKVEDNGGIVTYTYHGNGVMKSANYGSHVVSTEIDGWGRKIKLTDPSAGLYTYEYNSIGEILKETSPKGYTGYDYDGYGKITKKEIKGDETDMYLTYEYNADNLLSYIRGKNVRTNEDYLYTYLYDSQKRLYTTKEQNGKAYFEHQVTRDGYGRVDSETYISKNTGNNVSSTVKVRNIFDANSGILKEIQDFNNNTSLWKLKEVNERGQAKEVLLGNGIIKKRTYDQYGFLTKMLDQNSDATKIALNLEYSFNTARGNLNNRKNNNLSWNESFTYDNLDRLTNISGSVSRAQNYDDRGRITSNSTIGTYNYGSTTSYRLQEVDLNTQGDLYYQNHPLQKITYNAYKKPVSISVKDKAKVDFEYGLLQNRSHAYYGGNEDNKLDRRYQKHYSAISPVEIEIDKQGNTKIITYVGGDAYSAPVMHVKQTASGRANGYHYLHRDYLNSVLAITKSDGTVQEQRQFGAWGEIDKFKSLNSEIDFEYGSTLLNRGYTGHEHFMGVALIHMNGRMYDAKLGRFLSPDNYIQDPFSTQSFNRFGYVWNNPLKFTDQSGELGFIAAALIGALISVTTNGIINSIEGRPFFQGAGLAALTGAIGGALSFGIGEITQGLQGILKVGVQAVMHGYLGGMMSSAMGGEFIHGFAAGALGSLVSSGMEGLYGDKTSDFWRAAGTITAGSLSGGVGSVITGGKFWDGFRNGAISSSLNHVAHSLLNPKPKWEYKGKKYTSKAKLYRDILIDQAAEQFGIKDLIALAAAIDGVGLIDKPFQAKGASKGTSYASKYGSKLFPQEMPRRLPTHFRGGSLRYTKVFGRFLGRLAGPVGWGILIYDVGKTLYNTQMIYNSIVDN
ncbi:RHS repeat-associated core domain-containing protein [Tenacibaculum tangerinum]|uniref:RHS repeat-associated core domain-containing protein n=1 Tax=Tenacibaculum tangerinum TaxID=3038772 RepID=A0ABY8L3G0_9FLAO|nr:RHS repeat-associated core domain-containing protein [Tenacibaculum tangerinum]WGH75910.1 RHS repeat-associated core domain-containing protein [Tenacibaculum tangerinum]